MVNNIEFSERLRIVMNYYGLTATALASSIGVQRSSISHLISGRNKPSLDFVLKVLKKYPEVELYWLLNGEGDFPKKEKEEQQHAPTQNATLFDQKEIIDSTTKTINNSEIDKIVIFYKNGTFKSYLPS